MCDLPQFTISKKYDIQSFLNIFLKNVGSFIPLLYLCNDQTIEIVYEENYSIHHHTTCPGKLQ